MDHPAERALLYEPFTAAPVRGASIHCF